MSEKIDLNSFIKFDVFESSELGPSQGDSLEVNPAQGSIGQLMSVYVIQNLYHKKYYVGETLNTRNRISEHWNSLIRGNSVLKELQDDVKEIKKKNIKLEDCIKFTLVFYKSFVFADEQTLNFYNSGIRKLEAKLIKKLKDENKSLYNSPNFNYEAKLNEIFNPSKVPANSSPCLVFNRPYPNIANAAIFERIDKQALARRINDPSNDNYVSISRELYFDLLEQQEKESGDFIDLNNEFNSEFGEENNIVLRPKPKFTGVEYTDPFDETIIIASPSIRQFKVDMGKFLNNLSVKEKSKRNNLGIFRTMVNNTNEINDCKYTRLLLEEEVIYLFPDKVKRSGISVSVKVNGVIYNSLNEAAKAYNVTRKTMTDWCNKGVTTKGEPCNYVV